MVREDAAWVAGRIERLLDGLVAGGLRHVSRPVLGELEQLEKSAHAAGLVHLERELAALAAELGRYLGRDPTFRPAAYAGAATRAHLRATAARTRLARPPSDDDALLLGVHRRKYLEVPGRVLVRVRGAVGYVTDSGFTGITVHLQSDRGPLQAAMVRPTDWFGDDPKRLLFQPISEVTPLTVHELAHGAWWLDDVKASADGRLSLHAGLQAVPAPPAGADAFADVAVDGFGAAARRLIDAELDPLGGEPGATVLAVGVRPGEVRVDETRALARVAFTDRAGVVATVELPLLPRHDLLLDNLARLALAPPAAIYGRLTAGRRGLRFDPWTAWFDQPVKLGFRRGAPVQEVHLALEPLTGPVERRPAELAPEVEGPPDAVARALAEAQALLGERFAAGTALPGGLGPELAEAADRLREVGLADAAEAVAGAGEGAGTLQRASARLHLLARGWALLRLSEAPVAPAPRPVARRGADRDLLPLGLVRSGERVEIVAVDARDGARVLLEDTWTPTHGGVASRLFQATLDPAEVLARRISLVDHPAARTRAGLVVQPAWHTRATSGAPLALGALPRLAAPAAVPFRMALRAEPGPDGWVVLGPDGDPLDVAVDEDTALDLDKRAVFGPVSFEGVLAEHRGALHLLRVDGGCPAADPGLTRWPAARLRPLWPVGEPPEAALVTEARALGAGGRRHVLGAVAEARRALRADEPLPAAAVLWSWGRFLDPATDAPIAALGLPADALRRAVVRPLARWLRGLPEPGASDACRLMVGSGEAAHHLVDR